jgi:hypothetical protein
MPWTGSQFASKHNHRLKGRAASKAAAQATAMVKAGVPEGEAQKSGCSRTARTSAFRDGAQEMNALAMYASAFIFGSAQLFGMGKPRHAIGYLTVGLFLAAVAVIATK